MVVVVEGGTHRLMQPGGGGGKISWGKKKKSPLPTAARCFVWAFVVVVVWFGVFFFVVFVLGRFEGEQSGRDVAVVQVRLRMDVRLENGSGVLFPPPRSAASEPAGTVWLPRH